MARIQKTTKKGTILTNVHKLSILNSLQGSDTRRTIEDVDPDGEIDMLFHFDTQALRLTDIGTEGTGAVKMVPKEK